MDVRPANAPFSTISDLITSSNTVHTTGERGCEIAGPDLSTPPAGKDAALPPLSLRHQRFLSTNQPPQVVCCLTAVDSPQLVHGSPTPISTIFDIWEGVVKRGSRTDDVPHRYLHVHTHTHGEDGKARAVAASCHAASVVSEWCFCCGALQLQVEVVEGGRGRCAHGRWEAWFVILHLTPFSSCQPTVTGR